MLRGPEARLRLVSALLIAALLPIIGQLVRLQILERPEYQAEVEELVHRPYALLEPPKGVITDRNGDLLIGNMPIYNVGAEIKLITNTVTNTHYAAITLAPLLGVDVDWLEHDAFALRPGEADNVVVLCMRIFESDAPENDHHCIFNPLRHHICHMALSSQTYQAFG